MIQIVKASAGSGKTFRLTGQYLTLLLSSEDPLVYRHILAVTFTNKATDEMKRRILTELDRLARDPDGSPYTKFFIPKYFSDPDTLSRRARERLGLILHDYSAFAISTIDRFFQQALRAFSREIGYFASYQVELNRDALVEEGVARVLDNLTDAKEDSDLLGWLTESVKDELSRGGKFSLDKQMSLLAKDLSSDAYRELLRSRGIDEQKAYSKEQLMALIKTCRGIIQDFNGKIAGIAGGLLKEMERRGVSSKGLSVSMRKLIALAAVRSYDNVEQPSDAFFACCLNPDKWFLRANKADAAVMGESMGQPLQALYDLFHTGNELQVYRTALLLRGRLYGLGIAGELQRALVAVQKEKNVLSLDESNTLLRDIIDGSDAPFVYEKIGVRYAHFLLDEFQDTSLIQWNNFLPLLLEADASGGENLVVGDVKQSIYRWRSSDWRLLDSGVQSQFREALVETKKENRRTLPEIVEQNGRFFRFAAAQLDLLHSGSSDGPISRIYADAGQIPMTRKTGRGYMEVCFCPKGDAELDEVVGTVSAHVAGGGKYGDIAILVRGNAEGAKIADRLIVEGIPVISDDALNVKASVTVRRLVSQLSLTVRCGSDPAEAADAPHGRRSVNAYLARQMDFVPPESYHSLTDLAEGLLRQLRTFDPDTFEAEIPYIRAFMDWLQEWSGNYGNDLGACLRDWATVKLFIAPPEDGNSVRLMTIHKSKGLEFPLVILPYAEKTTLFKEGDSWCIPDTAGTALDPVATGAYQVTLSSKSEDTLFSADYRRERLLQLIDNLNIFYVAMTRPEYALKVIGAMPAKKMLDELKDAREAASPLLAHWGDMGQLLYGFVTAGDSGFTATIDGEFFRYSSGEPVDFSQIHREKSTAAESTFAPAYPSWPLNAEAPAPEAVDEDGEIVPIGERGRLKFSADAADFFGPDGSVGAAASRRIRGTVLHEILSRVSVPSDLPHAVESARRKGLLRGEEAAEALSTLSAALSSISERYPLWFSPEVTILNERAIIRGDGAVFRPDRIVVDPSGNVTVIDYKFGTPEAGELSRYRKQIGRYAALLRGMGYASVSAHLWYPLEPSGKDVY